jgi:hypothetical protein
LTSGKDGHEGRFNGGWLGLGFGMGKREWGCCEFGAFVMPIRRGVEPRVMGVQAVEFKVNWKKEVLIKFGIISIGIK